MVRSGDSAASEPDAGAGGPKKEPVKSGTEIANAARRAGVSPLAVAIAGDVAVWCAAGYSEEEWREEVLPKREDPPEEVSRAVTEIKGAGLWPWP